MSLVASVRDRGQLRPSLARGGGFEDMDVSRDMRGYPRCVNSRDQGRADRLRNQRAFGSPPVDSALRSHGVKGG